MCRRGNIHTWSKTLLAAVRLEEMPRVAIICSASIERVAFTPSQRNVLMIQQSPFKARESRLCAYSELKDGLLYSNNLPRISYLHDVPDLFLRRGSRCSAHLLPFTWLAVETRHAFDHRVRVRGHSRILNFLLPLNPSAAASTSESHIHFSLLFHFLQPSSHSRLKAWR